MDHDLQATANIYLSLIDNRWHLSSTIYNFGDESLDGRTYCDQDCIEHQDADVVTPLPTPYELTAILMESFPWRFRTRLVYLDSEDTYHPAWTREQAMKWAGEHIEAGFPLATVLQGNEVVESIRHDDYEFDKNGEPI